MNEMILGNCLDELDKIYTKYADRNIIIVTDPPFNIGYKYNKYKDNLKEDDYLKFIEKVFKDRKCVIIHYPEKMYVISSILNEFPEKVISWVYNSNTAKQHRDIAFFGVKPDMKKVRQPYKNQNDKRIIERMKNGATGAKLYDWWNINQVKNVSKVKTKHPCQMPLEVMRRIVGILPNNALIVDCFAGSGTTGVACKEKGIDFIGIELDKEYFDIAGERIKNTRKVTKLNE